MVWKAEELGGRVPEQREIARFARQIENPMHRALFILAYLTAGRIREVLSLTREQFKIEKIGVRKVLTIRHMLNEKNRKRHTKTFHIPIDKERALVNPILSYLNTKERKERIFPFKTRQRAWQILKQYGIFPHYLRHIRLTHLVTIYGFTDQVLVRFAGWTDSQPAQYYIELKAEDILDKMK